MTTWAAAVKKILRGFRREETSRFIAFRSHWGFASEFCTPGAGHEKGGVEGEAGYFRRNHWVPVPVAADLNELNRHMLTLCHADESRRIAGHEHTVGAGMLIERNHLLPAAARTLRPGRDQLPNRGWSGLRARANQRVFGSDESRANRPGQDLLQRRRTLAREHLRRAARAAVTANNSRFWTWSITWTCWSTNRAQ